LFSIIEDSEPKAKIFKGGVKDSASKSMHVACRWLALVEAGHHDLVALSLQKGCGQDNIVDLS